MKFSIDLFIFAPAVALVALVAGILFLRTAKKEQIDLRTAFRVLGTANLTTVILFLTTFFNVTYYSVLRPVQRGLRPYPTHATGLPLQFFENSSTEACSLCNQWSILIVPFLLDALVVAVVAFPLILLLERGVKNKKPWVIGFTVSLIVMMGAVTAYTAYYVKTVF